MELESPRDNKTSGCHLVTLGQFIPFGGLTTQKGRLFTISDGSPGKDHRRYLIELAALGIQFAGTVWVHSDFEPCIISRTSSAKTGQTESNMNQIQRSRTNEKQICQNAPFRKKMRRMQSEWTTEGLLFAWHHAARACLLDRISVQHSTTSVQETCAFMA